MWGMILYIQYAFCIMLALEGGEIEFQQCNSYLSWKKQTLRLTRKDARLRYMEWSNLTFDPWRTQADSAFKHWTQFLPLPIWVPYKCWGPRVILHGCRLLMFYVSSPPKAVSTCQTSKGAIPLPTCKFHAAPRLHKKTHRKPATSMVKTISFFICFKTNQNSKIMKKLCHW